MVRMLQHLAILAVTSAWASASSSASSKLLDQTGLLQKNQRDEIETESNSTDDPVVQCQPLEGAKPDIDTTWCQLNCRRVASYHYAADTFNDHSACTLTNQQAVHKQCLCEERKKAPKPAECPLFGEPDQCADNKCYTGVSCTNLRVYTKTNGKWDTQTTLKEAKDWAGRKNACVSYIRHGLKSRRISCKEFCEANGLRCHRAQDDAHQKSAKGNRCTIQADESHNDCDKTWLTQICACK